jgi:hypothetical protein
MGKFHRFSRIAPVLIFFGHGANPLAISTVGETTKSADAFRQFSEKWPL